LITSDFDLQALYAALDERRKKLGLTFGVADSRARSLSKGGRTAFPTVTRLTAWLDRPATDFVRRSPS
jgi:hypothetical protein